MLNRLDEVMIYVNNHDKVIDFWTTHLSFTVVEDTTEMDMRVVKLAPSEDAQTLIVLQDKEKVDAMDMGVSTATPSLIFATTNFDSLRESLQENGVETGEVMTLPMGRVFNFADPEQNYFAVKEVQ
ncbi:VOC family protein [Staphylococcus sp. 18_1_E_LY]|uniref:VOC family protein n=1 Tax=Staphylococcus lloydii TaxID=2781774 RepID=A0A7T1AZN0_9STAP|nr:VOC family protein [Staphylococcus lloydii]MBF7019667.1 VOC family protein [Staphylococcus lloydii]MBF7027395.1 VOC family protein [Staphylococcus lloydii]QPM75056.1 VOC family protein [Staphylococcus lloydii]